MKKEFKKYLKTCKVCNKEFEALHHCKVYCSRICESENDKRWYKSKLENNTDFEIFKRDDFQCIYCGKTSIEDGIKLQIDHIFPLSKGGVHEYFNLITSCQSCNISKYNKILRDEIIEVIQNIATKRTNSLSDFERNKLDENIETLRKAFYDRKRNLQKPGR